MKVASLLVPEECVRHPNLLRVSQGEILDPSYNTKVIQFTLTLYSISVLMTFTVEIIKSESRIIPLLSEGNLHSKLLRERN